MCLLSPHGFYLSHNLPFLSITYYCTFITLEFNIHRVLVTLQPCLNQTELMICHPEKLKKLCNPSGTRCQKDGFVNKASFNYINVLST